MIMENNLILELIGYFGTMVIAASLLSSSILRLRSLGLAGSIIFIVYGILIKAYPVALVNLLIAGTQLFYMQKFINKKELLKVLNIRPTNLYLKEFIDFYKKDLFHYFPNFRFAPEKYNECAFILRDMHVAGLFIASKFDDESLLIEMDFVIPEYRDFRLGKFLYVQHLHYFRENNYTRIISHCYNRNHENYLIRMGFEMEMIKGKRMFVIYTGLNNKIQ